MKLLGTFHPREYTNLYTSTEEASVLIHLITFRSKNNQNYKKKKKSNNIFDTYKMYAVYYYYSCVMQLISEVKKNLIFYLILDFCW